MCAKFVSERSNDDEITVNYGNDLDESVSKAKINGEVMDKSEEETIDKINGGLIRIRVSSNYFAEPMTWLEEFIEISKCLISLLPHVSVKSLFDVDDLLYGEQIKQDYKSAVGVKYYKINTKLYANSYSAFMRNGVKNVYMDTALMGLLEHMPVFFNNWISDYLLEQNDIYSTCVALKFMIAASNNQHVKFDIDCNKLFCDELQLELRYLKNIQGFSTDGRKLSNFISQHVDLFLTLAKYPNICVYEFDFVKVSILKIISKIYDPAYEHILSLIDTFMNFNSSKRYELPNFFLKLMEDRYVKAVMVYPGRYDAKDNKPNTSPQKLMRLIIDHIITISDNLGRNLLKVEQKMEFIDAIYGYKIEPYFTTNNEDKCHAFNNKTLLIINKEEDNIIFEKFFCYDRFMKSLHCLSIFNELFMELERRFDVKYPRSYVYYNFWNRIPTVGLVPWYVKMIVMKCPFLLKSCECEPEREIIFNDITSEEKEFIDSQNWAIKISKNKNPHGYKYKDPKNGREEPLPGLPPDYVDYDRELGFKSKIFQQLLDGPVVASSLPGQAHDCVDNDGDLSLWSKIYGQVIKGYSNQSSHVNRQYSWMMAKILNQTF